MQYDLYLDDKHLGGISAIGAGEQAWVVGYAFSYPFQGKKRDFAAERLTPEGGRIRVDLVRHIERKSKKARETPLSPGAYGTDLVPASWRGNYHRVGGAKTVSTTALIF